MKKLLLYFLIALPSAIHSFFLPLLPPSHLEKIQRECEQHQKGLKRQEKLKDVSLEIFLNLPDDMIREILLIKVDIYLKKFDKQLKIIKLCNLMAQTSRRMRALINSDKFIKAMADRFKNMVNPLHKNWDTFYFPTQYCYFNLVKELLERFKNKENEVQWNIIPLGTMMEHACAKKNTLLLELLLDNKADPNIEGSLGPPLWWATMNNNIIAINLLIEHKKLKIDKQNNVLKKTALHTAAESNKFKAAKCLLHHGASTEILNCDNKTPLDLARKAGHKKMVKLIESYKNKKEQ